MRIDIIFGVVFLIVILVILFGINHRSDIPHDVLINGIISDVEYISRPGGFISPSSNKTIITFEDDRVRVFDIIIDDLVLNKPIEIRKKYNAMSDEIYVVECE